MRKIPPAEWLLSQSIGSERAAAIMGDLDELAATRGRLWFWTAYFRALIFLGWRTGPAAFIFAFLCLRLIFRTVLPFLAHYKTLQLMDAGLFGEDNRHARLVCWNLSFVTAQCLIFVVPFISVRFGLHNRLTQLACTLVLIAMPVYSLSPWIMDLSGVLTALVLVAALLLSLWRRSLFVLAGTCVTAIVVKAACVVSLVNIYHQNIYTLSASENYTCDAIAFAIAAAVCCNLHRRFLEPPTSQNPSLA